MMHVKLYKHESLTAAGNFYKNFPCNIQNMYAADMFLILQNFQFIFPNSTCNQNFVIVINYSFHGISIVPPEKFHMQHTFLIN